MVVRITLLRQNYFFPSKSRKISQHSKFSNYYILILFPHSGLSFFGQDWAFIVIMIFFGMTNGYIAALAFEYAPAQVDSSNAGLIGSIMPVFMGFGLLCGAATSFLTVIALPSDH